MPSRPKRPCKGIGCPALVDSGYCDKCRPKAHQADRDARGSAQDRGYDARWHRYRDWYLRQHPLCVECAKAGVATAATIVDHIIPVRGPDDPRFYEYGNHQSLCTEHHAKKTAIETRG
jgi:5-methylcytosine-specific restriction protein A